MRTHSVSISYMQSARYMHGVQYNQVIGKYYAFSHYNLKWFAITIYPISSNKIGWIVRPFSDNFPFHSQKMWIPRQEKTLALYITGHD